MPKSDAVDGFQLAYDRVGDGEPVVLLHGWPGDRTDYRDLVPLLSPTHDVVVPDLRGFGESDKHAVDPGQYDAKAQARSVLGLVKELGLMRPILVGYDIGSRIAQAIAAMLPEMVRALVIAPPLPGIGRRILEPGPQAEFWYQAFHRLDLAERLVDGNPAAVREYLRHFWTHWSGPDYVVTDAALDRLVTAYGEPGAFVASIGWYRAGAGAVARSVQETTPASRITVPTTVLWPEFDPLFPRAWSDRVDEFFESATLTFVDGVGHFAPLEFPNAIANVILNPSW